MEEQVICPLCDSISSFRDNGFGVHCESLVCKKCGCNARNRFFYLTLKSIIKQLQLEVCARSQIKMLEASSYGNMALKNYKQKLLKIGVEVICSDFYQQQFKSDTTEDLCNLSLHDNSLQIISHSHVLEHIEDDMAAIRESFRCLTSGGVFVVSVPIQTDFTYMTENEWHGDNAYVYRRNGWDLVDKLKSVGFHVEVLVPPEHCSVNSGKNEDLSELVIDNVKFGEKFSANYHRYKELFYPVCSVGESQRQEFSEIWGSLEIFVARKVEL